MAAILTVAENKLSHLKDIRITFILLNPVDVNYSNNSNLNYETRFSQLLKLKNYLAQIF